MTITLIASPRSTLLYQLRERIKFSPKRTLGDLMSEQSTETTNQIGTGIVTSAFAELGMKTAVDQLLQQIQNIYLEDETPWVIGYSGGKDSTAVLQLIWMAIESLAPKQRIKSIHVVTNDTLVENPVVASWVRRSHEHMTDLAAEKNLPIDARSLTPIVDETFWVNLIGRGYPAPNRRFRWCTERMKINPTTRFIRSLVSKAGEAIIVLGARKAESASRAARIAKYDAKSVRDNLSPHNDLPAALVYKPIVDWTNDDVWVFLMSYPNPWGYDNKSLMTMYRSATADEECPLVIDTSTASCGNSRFGCWTCTLVEKDKSMSAMIQNSAEKEWMLPLLEIRDELADSDRGREMRDFRRMTGRVSLFNGEHVPGPYTQESRAYWLKRVLEAQTWVRENGPEDVCDIELVTMLELHEIRRIWVMEKHEHEDLLPALYESATGEEFPGANFQTLFPFDKEDLSYLKEETSSELQYELLRELISVEHSYRTKVRRVGIFDAIEKAFDRSGYETPEEAITNVKIMTRGRKAASEGARTDFETLEAQALAGFVEKDST